MPLSRPQSDTDTEGVGVSMGADINRAENADILVIHIRAAWTSRWREGHKIKHGLNLSEKKKKKPTDEKVTLGEVEGDVQHSYCRYPGRTLRCHMIRKTRVKAGVGTNRVRD